MSASLEWVEWCCVACRRHLHTIRWIADLTGVCRHAGTLLERPFWVAAGEPKTADLIDEKERRAWTRDRDGRVADGLLLL